MIDGTNRILNDAFKRFLNLKKKERTIQMLQTLQGEQLILKNLWSKALKLFPTCGLNEVNLASVTEQMVDAHAKNATAQRDLLLQVPKGIHLRGRNHPKFRLVLHLEQQHKLLCRQSDFY